MGIKLNLQIQMFKLSKVLVAALLLSSVEGRNLSGIVEVEREAKVKKKIDRSEGTIDEKVKRMDKVFDDVEVEEAKEVKKAKDVKPISGDDDAEEAKFEEDLDKLEAEMEKIIAKKEAKLLKKKDKTQKELEKINKELEKLAAKKAKILEEEKEDKLKKQKKNRR